MKPDVRICIALTKEAEDTMTAALTRLREAYDMCQRAYCDDGPAPACVGLMEIAVRALNQANDSARYARHEMRNREDSEAR